MAKVPCRNCEDRKLYCHSTCQKYIEYNEAQQKIRQNRIEYKDGLSVEIKHWHKTRYGWRKGR